MISLQVFIFDFFLRTLVDAYLIFSLQTERSILLFLVDKKWYYKLILRHNLTSLIYFFLNELSYASDVAFI